MVVGAAEERIAKETSASKNAFDENMVNFEQKDKEYINERGQFPVT